MAEWSKDDGSGRRCLALANEIITADVIDLGSGQWSVSVNGALRGTTRYASADAAQAAAERYLRRKLQQALAELGEEHAR